MAKQTINNQESAATVRSKINNNFTELYDGKANISHAFTDSSYGAASGSLYGHVKINVSNGLNISDGVLSIDSATTSKPGTVQLADSLNTSSISAALTAAQGKVLNDKITNLESNSAPISHASSTTNYGIATSLLYGHIKVNSGNGLLLDNGTLSLEAASTNVAGTVQLEDSCNSTSNTKALTANMGQFLYNNTAKAYSGTSVPSSALGKDGDIYLLIS